ncbi:MAG: DUF2892 domain-containing protein [Flavobacteriaceae bacterium]|jgi:tetratricopeptide (TPR) repeat protein|nr:DUF2892 domain-containing protein [Flavobacteriaceae bacterium]MBT7458580.1 DUF2892 domain-containing protein [Flavobacteriaceae bacterium]MDG0966887.1 DUF2892 domain-containing protein [Flavobacteriaceae bacterium]
MFPKFIKIVLAAATLGYAVYQFIEESIGNGIALIFLAGIFVFLYYKNEILLLAFLRLRKQDFKGTEKWLNRIKKPEAALTTKQVGYYHFIRGVITSQSNLTQAEKYFRKAIALGLNMKHDMAMAKLSLAGIAMQKRRKREATTLIKEAKKLDKQGMMGEQIKLMQQQLKRI